ADQWALHLQHEFKDMVYNTPISVWPANGKMREIDVSNFLDAAGPAEACVAEVWSDEAVNGAADVLLGAGTLVSLRARRSGSGDGRSYTIHLAAPDPVGKLGTAALFQVLVPHDQRPGGQVL